MTATAPAPAPAPAALPEADLDALARELDAIGEAVRADLGTPDAAYIHRLIATQRGLEAAGRALLILARYRPAQAGGTVLLTLAKVLENMEIGHNVLHGQWDWMRDPKIQSTTWEWDAASTSRSWRRSHNFQHHVFTNVIGKDRDLGYSAMRVHPDQPWHPVYLLQPVYGLLMALVFEWGIALYDMELDAVRRGEKSKAVARSEIEDFARKAVRQLSKDYVLFRNVWVHTIVFMGHLPDGAEYFTEEDMARETPGGWYHRQLLGSCNLDGTRLFHILAGSLSFQIEHHLFPDVPSRRYPQLAPQVRAVCERHGLPYSSGRLGPQWVSVARKILRLSLPGGG
jgi:linoleoyl-CoA desaturase